VLEAGKESARFSLSCGLKYVRYRVIIGDQVLNKGRVNLKHHGTFPSRLDIEGYRATTRTFVQTASSLIFDVDFDRVSMPIVTPWQEKLLAFVTKHADGKDGAL
jgi:hypothetical protein